MPEALRQLLIQTRRGDEASARQLWNSQSSRVLHYARAILASPADAEDVTQAVFCKIIQLPRREVEAVRDPAAWLARITRREAINHLRAAGRERRRREASAFRLSGSSGFEPAQADPELEEAIENLPRRLREVVILKNVGELTFDQISAATGVNRNTAASRYSEGLARLQACLALERASHSRPRTARPATTIHKEARHA